VVVLSLFCVVALQHYVRSSISGQYLHSHHQVSQLLLDSLAMQNLERLQQQLETRLESLPGWLAAVYDESGNLLWLSQAETMGLDLTNTNPARLASSSFVAEQDWLISQQPLPAQAPGQHELTVTLFSSRQAEQQQTSLLSNLIFATAMVVGLLIWWVVRLNSRHIRSDIRRYLRANRKEFTHDSLTGLPNREILLDRIEHGLAQARRIQSRVALIYIALDGFRTINDTFGHAFGDQVLRSVSARLTSASRESDTLVRIEGDQFALLMTDMHHQEEVEAVARRIMQALKAPVEAGNKQCVISASIGISTDEHIEHDQDRLVLNAYTAMLDVKQTAGGNGYRFFNPEMSSQYMAAAEKDAELYTALEKEEFCLFYQPKVDAVTGAIKGMEALIRWQHPERGMVSPVEFIPALEKSGLIVLVGEWVLREACRVNKAWQDEGLPPLKVSVNVATPQFKQDGFVDMVKEILESTRLDPGYLEIEVTESCLMDDDAGNIEILDQIKALGVSISVDDFGTGYSSLSYLKRFPIDTLKIDRSFITNVQDRKTNDNAAIVTAIMALSHSLRLEVVAEGVETPQELAYLHALGCRTIQGFLFSRPVSQQEFRALQQDSVSLKQTLETVREALR
jgi:diguanylate cyclase (GGDEF)-like protein